MMHLANFAEHHKVMASEILISHRSRIKMKVQTMSMLLFCLSSSRNRLTSSFGVSIQKFHFLGSNRLSSRVRPLFWGEEEVDDKFSTNKSGISSIADDGKGRRFRGSANIGSNKSNNGGGGWDDVDDVESRKRVASPRTPKSKTRSTRSSNGGSRNFAYNRSDGGWQDSQSSPRFERSRPDFNKRGSSRNERMPGHSNTDTDRINLRALDAAGFQHLYGLAPIVNALSVNRREWPTDNEDDDGRFSFDSNNDVKPAARLQSGLFVQDGKKQQQGSGKAETGQQIINLAKIRGIPIHYVDKGILNTLSGNRPHQGFVLRCGGLDFKNVQKFPKPAEYGPKLWLVLDEVVDPQNFGALVRSSYFLGGASSLENEYSIGIVVCQKNSAPLSPVVSAASAGAVEFSYIYSTSNLPKILKSAKDDGWRVMGAAAEAPSDVFGEPRICHDLNSIDTTAPTILVLGSEGYGLRALVARACTEFVRIPGYNSNHETGSSEGVDSLNVSVTGGIMLWHLKELCR